MAKHVKKRKTKVVKSKSYLPHIIVAAVIVIICVLIGTYISSKPHPNEITKNDVIANHVATKDIEFFGIKLGDSVDTIRKKMGKADYDKAYSGNVENLEYEKKLGLDTVGILFHTESGVLTSVTIKDSFNKYLVGETKIQYTKEQMFHKFGVATPVDAVYPYMVYTYKNYGFKVIMDQDKQAGWIFFL